MICPHCGQETADNSIRCDNCGQALHTGVNWGVRKPSNAYHAQYSSDTEKLTNYVAVTPALKKAKPQGLKIAAGIAAAVLVAIVGFAGFTAAQNTRNSLESSASFIAHEERLHDVILSVDAPDLDDAGSLIPLQITGADSGNNAYEALVYIKPDGTGISLPAGNYGVHPVASPITAHGGLFTYSDANKWFNIDPELEEGAVVDASADVQLVFEPADPAAITEDAIAAAKKYATEGGGKTAEEVDGLLAGIQDAIAAAKRGGPFSNVQTYRGRTYAGDIRTNTGYIPVSGVPDIYPIITRTDCFLFTGNMLYYADNSPNNTGSSIALHSRNMSTGQESVIATDLSSQTRPQYTDGRIIYTATTWGSAITVIDTGSGESWSLSERLPGGFSKLVGARDGAAYVATADDSMPQICVAPLGEGEQNIVSFGEEPGTVYGIFDDTVLVTVSGWDQSKVVGYSLTGEYLWHQDVEGNTQLSNTNYTYNEGILCAVSSGGKAIVRVDMKDGSNRVFDSNVAYLFSVMYPRGNSIYFAGSDRYANYDDQGTAMATYTTYEINAESGEIADLGSYEAPQDEDLAAQQNNMYWNNSNYWGYTGTGTDTTNTWGYTGDGTAGTGTDGTANTWGYTGTDTTNTWGYTGTDTTNTWGYTGTDGTAGGYGTNPYAGDWDANGGYVGGGMGGYDATGNYVSQ
ncbi:MAG: hypothetical protein IJ113_03075 [Eggerthellaceae bacterium]|nr:hypothetical protein [Eggerthellaceae bacterium]